MNKVDIIEVLDADDGTLQVVAELQFVMTYPPSYADYTDEHKEQMKEWIQARVLESLGKLVVEPIQPPVEYNATS